VRLRRRSVTVVPSDAAILNAAVDVLGADPHASLERVATAARTDARTVRSRYPTRDSLIQAVVLRGARRIADAAVLEDGTPPEQVGLLVGRLWDDQAPVAPFTAMWMRSDMRPEVERALDPVRLLLADAVARGAATHGMRLDVPETTVAWLVEHAVLTCLAGVADGAVARDAGRRLAVTHALTATGLAWEVAAHTADAIEARLGPG